MAAVIRGLTDQGADVLDIGMVSTDQYYFACATLGLPGMMVTASHNPKAYNGFKMVRRMPYLLSGDEGIQDIRRLVEADAFPEPPAQGRGRPGRIFKRILLPECCRSSISPLCARSRWWWTPATAWSDRS